MNHEKLSKEEEIERVRKQLLACDWFESEPYQFDQGAFRILAVTDEEKVISWVGTFRFADHRNPLVFSAKTFPELIRLGVQGLVDRISIVKIPERPV